MWYYSNSFQFCSRKVTWHAHATWASLITPFTITWVTAIANRWISRYQSQIHMVSIWNIAASSGVFYLVFTGRVGQPLFLGWTHLTVVFVQQVGCSLQSNLCVSGSHTVICDCSIVSYGSWINLNMFLYSAAFKTKDTAPQIGGSHNSFQ